MPCEAVSVQTAGALVGGKQIVIHKKLSVSLTGHFGEFRTVETGQVSISKED